MAEMLRYESEPELLLQSLRTEIFNQPINYDEFLAQLRDRGSYQGFECTWRCQDRKTILVRLGGWSVLDETGEISYLEVFAENVTERKQLENQLRQALGLPAKTSFTGITGESTESFPTGLDGNNPASLDFTKLTDINGNNVALPDTANNTTTKAVRKSTTAARLKAVYGSVDNVDAFVGMVAEKHIAGTEFGELQLAMWTIPASA